VLEQLRPIRVSMRPPEYQTRHVLLRDLPSVS
jgi:hypothetical protein